ncbi:hypothetical protein [Mucilaginibacter lappiensis]|uniref:hypothetical protein n=1 Tax=Mucilaginibacter lappiensis TaxID=354630 RepID=UPI003D1AD9DC
MAATTAERANYIIIHYLGMLTEHEMEALKHHRHPLKLRELPDGELRTKIYLRNQWLSDEPEILKQLDKGYVQFILNCAERILKDNPDKVYFNLCPVCRKLARTPDAKQCRFCGHDWH